MNLPTPSQLPPDHSCHSAIGATLSADFLSCLPRRVPHMSLSAEGTMLDQSHLITDAERTIRETDRTIADSRESLDDTRAMIANSTRAIESTRQRLRTSARIPSPIEPR